MGNGFGPGGNGNERRFAKSFRPSFQPTITKSDRTPQRMMIFNILKPSERNELLLRHSDRFIIRGRVSHREACISAVPPRRSDWIYAGIDMTCARWHAFLTRQRRMNLSGVLDAE